MRILFAGTPEPAVIALDQLVADGHHVVGVLTRTDAPIGRKRVMTPSPVAVRAEELGLPVIKADSLRDASATETMHKISALNPEIGAVVAYGGLLPQAALDLLPKGWINLHFSLLPAYRGAAPVQWAIINQEPETGAAVFQLEAGLDTGPVYATLQRALAPHETAGEVLTDLSHRGGALLSATLREIAAGIAQATPQEGEPTWAPKLTSHHAKIDPAQPADTVRGLINGTTPAPGAWGMLETADGTASRFKIGGAQPARDIDVADHTPGTLVFEPRRVLLVCQDGAIELTNVQPAGKKIMRATDWARGVSPDTRLQTSGTHPAEFEAHKGH